MSFYKSKFLKEVVAKKEKRERGEYNGIPFCFPNYRNYVESIDPGVYYGLLSGTGNGKSFWMRFTFIYEPLKFALESGYKLKILYFALEDSKMQIYKKLISYYLWTNKGIYIPQKLIDSKIDPLPNRYLEMMEEEEEFFKIFEENVFIINDNLDPDSILETCENAHAKFGEDHHMIAIIDNYANITQGNYASEYEAIMKLSREHIRLNIVKKLNWSVLAIMQSDQDSEKYASRNTSTGNISSIEPNLGSIGKIKIINQDMHIIWALFNPWRYGLLTYPNSKGYNIDNLRNRFRSLIMLKNNLGDMAPRLGLYFDGSKGLFSELPAVTQEEELQRIYLQVLEEEKKIKESRSKN
ncbi:MAG: hypothetical protein ACEQSQ_06090 [Candidatus Paceibacteria bacterium]